MCFCLMSHQQLMFHMTGLWLKVSSDRLVKPGIEPATPALQGEWLSTTPQHTWLLLLEVIFIFKYFLYKLTFKSFYASTCL